MTSIKIESDHPDVDQIILNHAVDLACELGGDGETPFDVEVVTEQGVTLAGWSS